MMRSDISKRTVSLCLACAAVWSPTLRAQQTAPAPKAETITQEPSSALLELPSLTDELMESRTREELGLEAVEGVSTAVGLTGTEQPRASRWKMSPHLRLEATYDDNIFIQPTNKVADFVYTVAPGLAAGYWDYEDEMDAYLDRGRSASQLDRGQGNFLYFDYTAILLGFATNSSQNAFNQNALFDARWRMAKLTLTASTSFTSLYQPVIDLGGRVQTKRVSTEVTANYQLSERTALAANFYNVIQEQGDFLRTVEWRNESYFEYQLTPLIRVDLGGAVGVLQVKDYQDQVFQRVLAGVAFDNTSKISFTARGGMEFRQSDGPQGDTVTPVFTVSARYALAEATVLVLDGYRRVTPSAAQPNQNFTATGAALRFDRTLRTGLLFSAGVGYEHTVYTQSSGLPQRRDDICFASAGVVYNFARWGSVGVRYEFSQNESSDASFSFDNNRVSLDVGLIY